MITDDQIYDIIKEVSPGIDTAKIDIAVDLKQYGLDSIDMFNVILMLQDALGREIPDRDIHLLRTISSIKSYVNPAHE